MESNLRNILIIDPQAQSSETHTLDAAKVSAALDQHPFLGGESICQYLLREKLQDMVMARGSLPFLPGNKLTVGYLSPLTDVPHYSFVGGHAAAHLFYLNLHAIVLKPMTDAKSSHYVTVDGRFPNLQVRFFPAKNLPTGQRAAYYYLVERELSGEFKMGSVFTVGSGALHEYQSANLAVEAIFHAGRGGAGHVFGSRLRGMVLKGKTVSALEHFGKKRFRAFQDFVGDRLSPRLDKFCGRLARPNTGTILKLRATGQPSSKRQTLPTRNAQQFSYQGAGLGHPDVLEVSRDGHTACRWCEIRCRHLHRVPAAYAKDGKDAIVDDFEPAYAICSMLQLDPKDESTDALIELKTAVDTQVVLPIEELGCDVIDIGVALAAVFEGVEKKLLTPEELPEVLQNNPQPFGNLQAAAALITLLQQGDENRLIRAMGDGPEALAAAFPALKDLVFTCGKRTLGNPGHCNALWTFLMPFSRFFGHYSGQIYKIDEPFAKGITDDEADVLFDRVIARMRKREIVSILCNSLSMCSFVFTALTRNGKGEDLESELLHDLLALYDLEFSDKALQDSALQFLQASLAMKADQDWTPPSAKNYPKRIFEGLSQVLGETPQRCEALFDRLIDAWKRQQSQQANPA